MLKKLLFIMFICLLTDFIAAGQAIINLKGTKMSMDTSKWKLNGADIYTKNTGNTGIGINVPLYKLDVNATTNPLRLSGLQAGTASDSVLTVQNGVVRYVSISRLLADSSIYKYDGTLAGNRIVTLGGKTLTFATGGTAFSITGLGSGAATDSIVTINTGTGQLRNVALGRLIADTSFYKYDGTLTANRTLTMGGKTLTFATGGTAFNISGLTSGAATDSLLTINPSTNRVGRISVAQLIDSTTASNGLSLSGNDVQLGGTLSKKDTLVTSASNTLAIKGLQVGTDADSMLVVESGTGVLKKVSQASTVTIKTTATQSNSTTTAATINVLNFTTVAGYIYRVRLWLVYNSAAAGTGIRLGPNTFSGGNYWYTTQVNTTATGMEFASGFNAVNMLVSTGSRATTANVAVVEMTIEATSAATVSFQFASEVANNAITIQANSRLEYEIIN